MATFSEIILSGAAAVGTALIAYHFGKRSKIDDLRIKRRQELAEELAIALQRDHELRESLIEQFTGNLKHLGREEAIQAFKKHAETLYKGMCEEIDKLPETRNKIGELLRQGVIYFNKPLVKLIKDYLDTTEFSYTTDGIGGIFFSIDRKSVV